jgi:hypothetical protein
MRSISFFNGKPVEAGGRKAQEQADSAFEHEESISKGARHLLIAALHRRGIRHSSMRSHGLAGPNGTDFLGCLITDRRNKTKLQTLSRY